MKVPDVQPEWRKSTFSGQETNCVELHPSFGVRDSKSPTSRLEVSWSGLVSAVKADRITC